MKVAILSMQEVKNYGSFLQAFSLKKTIESLGNTCEFINIIPGEQLGNYKISKFHKIKLLIQRLWGRDFIRRLSSIYIFQTRFSKEFLPYLGVESERNIRHYDVIVIGSDEVFNCAQKTWFGFSRQLFGEGLNADKIITYAASFGATTVDKLQELGIKKIVGRLLGNISVISVRDANSSITVKTLIGKVPVMHLDPVLIFNYDLFMPSNVTLKNYMIVYTYPGRITDKQEIQSIKDFAKPHRLKLISIGHYFSWCDDVVIPSPFEVLAYFKNASYIVTDTFHGSVFSIKYNKAFCTIIRNMNNQKLSYLLKQFHLESRIINDIDKLDSILTTPIDYKEINEYIAKETRCSIEYLKTNICK